MLRRAAVIMAGGKGSRLYPLSQPDNPKQFLQIFDGESLFEKTYNRLQEIYDVADIYVITDVKYRDIVKRLFKGDSHNIIYEPCGKNTGIAVVNTIHHLRNIYKNTDVITFYPADHYIQGTVYFNDVINHVTNDSVYSEGIGLIGITPKEYSNQYGYIGYKVQSKENPKRMDIFIEKPSGVEAEEIINDSERLYAQNIGIFTATLQSWIRNLTLYMPEYFSNTVTIHDLYSCNELHPISIDYAVMEHMKDNPVFVAQFQWDDLGSWDSLRKHFVAEYNNNVVIVDNEIDLYATKNSWIYSDGSVNLIHAKYLNDKIVNVVDGTVYVMDGDGDGLKSFANCDRVGILHIEDDKYQIFVE